MLYVCYMFSKHITCFKASVYRGLRSVMLYGYMFLRNSFLFNTKVQRYRVFIISLCLCISVFTKILHVGCEALGFKTLGDNP